MIARPQMELFSGVSRRMLATMAAPAITNAARPPGDPQGPRARTADHESGRRPGIPPAPEGSNFVWWPMSKHEDGADGDSREKDHGKPRVVDELSQGARQHEHAAPDRLCDDGVCGRPEFRMNFSGCRRKQAIS